jgi:PAS domain S-box-containing protein
VVKSIGTLQSMTDRKSAQQSLEESEVRLELAQEAAGVGVWDWDLRTGAVHWSKELFKTFGLESDSRTLSFEDWIDCVHPEDRDRTRSFAEQALKGERDVEEEYRINRPDGEVRWLVGKGRTYMDDAGHPIRMMGIAFDITERKRAQLALAESEARYRAIVEGQTELICRFNPDMVLIFVNEAYCRYFHKTSTEIVGQSVLWIVPENQRAQVIAHMTSLKSHPRVASRDQAVMNTDGALRWLEWTDRAITDDQGCVTEVQSIGRDVTERKHAETTLRGLSQRLLQLQDEERRRIARELHDSTAQSLAALSLNLTVVETEAARLTEEARKALNESLALARHSSRELRTLSYLLHPPLLDESGLISAARWYVDGLSKRSGIRIDLDLPAPPCRLARDLETALFRIMQECLTNIIKHSGSPTARIHLTVEPTEVSMEIRDEGKGLPTAFPDQEADRISDLGVGIMGMHERVRQLYGRLDFKSGAWGTAVTVTLPRDGKNHG